MITTPTITDYKFTTSYYPLSTATSEASGVPVIWLFILFSGGGFLREEERGDGKKETPPPVLVFFGTEERHIGTQLYNHRPNPLSPPVIHSADLRLDQLR